MSELPKQNETTSNLAEPVPAELLLERDTEKLVLEHPSYKQMLEQLSQAEQQAQEQRNNWLLAQADLENLRRRTEREIVNAHKYALEKFAYEILGTVDNLERSLATKISDDGILKDFYVGIKLTLKSLMEVLQKFGISVINPLGEPFDHERHTAITTREDPAVKANTILEVIQKGYWLKDRLLRPALVVVAK